MSFETDTCNWIFKLHELLYLHVLYYPPIPRSASTTNTITNKDQCFIYQSVETKYSIFISFAFKILCMNWKHEFCVFSSSWFDTSLFTTRIKTTLTSNHGTYVMRKCNAHAVKSCMIVFGIVGTSNVNIFMSIYL